MLNHEAIYRVYPNAITIDDGAGAFDADGNQIELNQSLIDAAAIEVAAEQEHRHVEQSRASAYRAEADPLFFQYQAGEVTKEEWLAKREEIRARYPYPTA